MRGIIYYRSDIHWPSHSQIDILSVLTSPAKVVLTHVVECLFFHLCLLIHLCQRTKVKSPLLDNRLNEIENK